MGTFNYDSFADLTGIFALKKSGARLMRAFRLPAAPPPKKPAPRITLDTFPQSRFTDFHAIRMYASARFKTAAAKPEKKRGTLKLKIVASSPEPAEEPVAVEKPRLKLKLKEKVDLPPPVMLTRASSASDLAAAFRAEMRIITEKTPAEIASTPAIDKSRRLSARKSWAALIAASQEPPQRTRDFDLASAFRSEMKKMLEKQEAPADTSNVVAFPAKYEKFSLATRRRVLGNHFSG